ncbi:MAG TPA: 3-dehydroquinate synthase [Candidatus Hydrogenedentes bacterium]|nr:3-dehydroquinate synthase [Candidatus Hydrogenedentota bacterium]
MIPLPAEVPVNLGARSYLIHVGRNNLERIADLASPIRGVIGVVTDTNVGPLYERRVTEVLEGHGHRVVVYRMPAGEENKRLDAVEAICGAFLEGELDRASMVVALGGGVVGDVAGFAAGVFMRGIPFIQVPTTIVAQVDSSVGGKTGVNHPLGKNTIGVFHQPSGVVIDMELLRTLPPRELRAGLAEVVKHGVIADADLFAYMEREADRLLAGDPEALAFPVVRSCEIKAAVVAADEREQGIRAHLNYGHTFGHAIETVSGYTRFLHGEAVSLGMCAAADLARRMGMVDDGFVSRQEACLAGLGLPVRWPELPVDAAMDAARKDKKSRAGVLRFVLPTRLGEVVVRDDVPAELARQAFASIARP